MLCEHGIDKPHMVCVPCETLEDVSRYLALLSRCYKVLLATSYEVSECPVCRRCIGSDGHASDCELTALLKELP